MSDKYMPLRYQISSWRQLSECLSNNSKLLHIHVSDFINNVNLRGFRISVDHEAFGTLFACVLNARGDIITDDPTVNIFEMTPEQILNELTRYGFYVEYKPTKRLPGDQITYLLTIKNLGYDKLRVLHLDIAPNEYVDNFAKVIAFKSSVHSDWLDNLYVASEKEFVSALVDGTAVNLTDIYRTKQFRWDWLDFVANIDDIINDTADELIYGVG